MASATEICNLALSHLGSGKEIGNLTTERSPEAQACRRFYEASRNIVLRDFAWPFATKIAALALISETPTTEWGYAYQYPTDCIDIRRILSGTRIDFRSSRVPFKIGQDASGLILYCDQRQAFMEYTMRADDPSRYPPDFVMALSFRLAAYIAPRVTGGDPFKMGERAMQLYEYEVSRAKASAANEEQADLHPESEFIRVRE